MTAEKADSCPNSNHNQIALTAEQRNVKVRQLNDCLRMTGRGGQVLVTEGVISQGLDFARQALASVSEFKDFTTDNDPWGEHDCAVLRVSGIEVIFKIDYYDLSMTHLSQCPHDPKSTKRVLTLMLAKEY
jgi:Protein of unknown function (DUF3768)